MPDDPQPMQFLVTIGETSNTYVLYRTHAVTDYDGFGTLTVFTDFTDNPERREPERYVLVNVKHELWQINRYASGLRRATAVPEDLHLRRWVECQLWERITHNVAQETK